MNIIRRYTAEVTDPVTQEVTILVADSEVALDRRIDEHLDRQFPHHRENAADGTRPVTSMASRAPTP